MKYFAVIFLFVAACASAQLPAQSLEQIKVAADAGDPAAQDKMATRDMANAEMWYRKAAQQGFAHAQGKLGDRILMRAQLTISTKPEERAALVDEGVKWATLAANQGDKQGETTLARIFLEGKSVKQDLIEAYKWGDLSAKNPSFEFIVYFGASLRDSAILKMDADQIAEAKRRVAAFVPHQPSKSELPEPAWVKKIKLQGISGPSDHRLASINGKIFEKGDQIVLKVDGKNVTVSCLEIRETSVSVSIEGIEGACELKMADN
jgi:hypothetical protein